MWNESLQNSFPSAATAPQLSIFRSSTKLSITQYIKLARYHLDVVLSMPATQVADGNTVRFHVSSSSLHRVTSVAVFIYLLFLQMSRLPRHPLAILFSLLSEK